MFTKVEKLISSRNLKPKKKEGFLKVISAFSFIGIMLGVAILIIVMSVMNGFRTDLTNKILGLNPHIVIEPNGHTISDDFKKKLIEYLLSEKFFEKKILNPADFDQKYFDLISIINTNAPVKIIHINKDEAEVISLFSEVINEIKKIELKKKIEFLENKVSLNLDEKLYSALLLLRNQLKGG